jgi:hypothetical protein
VKHPVDGSLYGAGHYLVDGHFFHRYIEVLPAQLNRVMCKTSHIATQRGFEVGGGTSNVSSLTWLDGQNSGSGIQMVFLGVLRPTFQK